MAFELPKRADLARLMRGVSDKALAEAAKLAGSLWSLCKANPVFAVLGAAAAFFGLILPLVLAIWLTVDLGAPGPRRVEDLLARFAAQDYDLQAVAEGRIPVPRQFLKRLPRDWRRLTQAGARKRAFIMIVLPLVLQANERILAERDRLSGLRKSGGKKIGAKDRAWLDKLAVSYGLETADMKELILRVDIIPPSLAIAQAVVESGWGTSRFSTEGNALFGQWTEQGRRTMVPAERLAGRTHAVRRFKTLAHSVAAYMRNLNTHRAYGKFRARRAGLRAKDRAIDGDALVKYLAPYSQRGPDYVRALRGLIDKNKLAALDKALLQP